MISRDEPDADEYAKVVFTRLAVLVLVEEYPAIVDLPHNAPPVAGDHNGARTRLQHELGS